VNLELFNSQTVNSKLFNSQTVNSKQFNSQTVNSKLFNSQTMNSQLIMSLIHKVWTVWSRTENYDQFGKQIKLYRLISQVLNTE